MKIGILVSFICNFGEKGFYNSQEIGMAKALAEYFEEVEIYKLISADGKASNEIIGKHKNIKIHMIPCKNFGINGIVDTAILDKSLDALVYFSDTQLSVPAVFKWAKKNNTVFFPYIGVVESHSTNAVKKALIDFLFKRNVNVYKKCLCFAKTPFVKAALQGFGVNNIEVAPVGLDLELLKSNFEEYDVLQLKEKYGYKSEDRILLFIGRLEEEKRPLKMIEILEKILIKNKSFKLIMVGTGSLKLQLEESIKKADLYDKVKMIDKIPNSDIWELYRIADAFVNLNRQEIFGMAILEAMYYGCKVVAAKAPGPDFIINNGIDGCIVKSDDEIIDAVINKNIDPAVSQKRILDAFTWDKTARIIKNSIQNHG